ncbi:MAG: hypothetical protein ACJ8E0_10395 [Sphingomicrobium sp.]
MKSIGLGIFLLLDLAAPARLSAQMIGGELGPQSRAAVRISVSTLPRFELGRTSAPGLRYSVITEAHDSEKACMTAPAPAAPAASCAAPFRAGDAGWPLVLIVIPD